MLDEIVEDFMQRWQDRHRRERLLALLLLPNKLGELLQLLVFARFNRGLAAHGFLPVLVFLWFEIVCSNVNLTRSE